MAALFCVLRRDEKWSPCLARIIHEGS